MSKHHKEVHPVAQTATSTPTIPTEQELQYSFYNSPKDLKLDLVEYIIRVERKQ